MRTVLICGTCDKVCSPQRRKALWQELTLFMSKHNLTVKDLTLVHTYCPDCELAKKNHARMRSENSENSAA